MLFWEWYILSQQTSWVFSVSHLPPFFLICHFQPFLKRHRVADRGAWLACGDNCRFLRRLAERGAVLYVTVHLIQRCPNGICYSTLFFFLPFTRRLSRQMPRSDIIGGENVYNDCRYSSKGWWAYKHPRLNIWFLCKKKNTNILLDCCVWGVMWVCVCVVGGGENDQRMLTLMGV